MFLKIEVSKIPQLNIYHSIPTFAKKLEITINIVRIPTPPICIHVKKNIFPHIEKFSISIGIIPNEHMLEEETKIASIKDGLIEFLYKKFNFNIKAPIDIKIITIETIIKETFYNKNLKFCIFFNFL